jgi:hypothetical protein
VAFGMKRAVFRHPWLPCPLVLLQMVVTAVFCLWPGFDSLRLSLFKAWGSISSSETG